MSFTKKINSANNTGKWVAGAVGAGLLLWWLWPDDKSGGTTDEDLDVNKKNLTYPKNQYKIFADSIEAFIWGTSAFASWTEDDDAIGEVLKMMYTPDDVYQLITDYGKRYVGVFLQDGGNLVECIAEYLDDDVKHEVNQVYLERNIPFVWA